MSTQPPINNSCPMFLPDILDADAIIDKKYAGSRSDFKANLKATMYFILDSIILRMGQRTGKEEFESTGYVKLSSKLINDICGKRYTEAKILLMDARVIKINDSYLAGAGSHGYSKGFCLVGHYLTSKHKVRELPESSIKRKIVGRRHQNDLELSKISYITKWFNDKLTIDLKGVHVFIEFYREQMLGKVTDKSIINAVNTRYNSSITSAEMILVQNFRLSRTGGDNRLHSTVTSMKKELRPFLRYNSEPLVGIDIKSSQPYLLTQLLRPDLYDGTNKELDINSLYTELAAIIPIDKVKAILMFVSYAYSFEKVNWESDFYNYLTELEEREFKGQVKFFKTRQAVKKSMMSILYDKVNNVLTKKFQRFKTLFPKEAKLIELFGQLGAKDEGYLPILMQRIESRLMLDLVCKEVSNRLPDAPIIPVHDSILTTEKYQEPVKEIMFETLFKHTGIKPGLKLENDSAYDMLNNVDSTAAEDLEEVKKSNTSFPYDIEKKDHLAYIIPELKGKKILSTRYLDPKDQDVPYEPVVNAEDNEPLRLGNSYEEE